MSSQLLLRNEFSSNLAEACGKHFVCYTRCPTKNISNFEGQYPTLPFNKNHQIYTI